GARAARGGRRRRRRRRVPPPHRDPAREHRRGLLRGPLMLARILDWSLHNRALVIALWACIALAGVLSALRLPLDAFPDTTPVQVHVNTVAPALSPLEIERQITAPLEASLGGLPGLSEVRSVSKFGFSQITATF